MEHSQIKVIFTSEHHVLQKLYLSGVCLEHNNTSYYSVKERNDRAQYGKDQILISQNG